MSYVVVTVIAGKKYYQRSASKSEAELIAAEKRQYGLEAYAAVCF